MDLSHIVIVLCRPNESGNIGAVCRAMSAMGLKHLRIVGTKTDYNILKIRRLAVHAFDIWETAGFYADLCSAVEDCTIALGTTRRTGQKRKECLMLPEEGAARIFSVSPVPSAGAQAAFVFGNERTGLTDAELNVCNGAVTIPAESKSGSINLSHAVQIIAYELYRYTKPTTLSYTPLSLKRLHKTVHIITDNLRRIGFFSLGSPENMERFWLSVLSRAALSEDEAAYIEKTFHKAACLALKHKVDILGTDKLL